LKIDRIKQKLNKIKLLINQNIVEILILIGLFFIIKATFMINIILGLYISGFICIALAVFLVKYPDRK